MRTDRQTGRQTDGQIFTCRNRHSVQQTDKSRETRHLQIRTAPQDSANKEYQTTILHREKKMHSFDICTYILYLVPGIFFVSAVGGRSVRFIFCFVLTCHQRQSGLNKSGVWPSPATYSITEPHRSNSYCKNTENLRAFLGTPLRLPDNILRESDTPGFHGTIGMGSGHRGNPWDGIQQPRDSTEVLPRTGSSHGGN